MEKWHDCGKKSDLAMPVKEASTKESVYYPSLYFSGKQFPELADLKVGDTFSFEVQGKLTSMTKRESGREKSASFDVEILKVRMDSEEA